MLCLTLRPGEYLTIGEEVVVQYDRAAGDRCKLVIQAPREVHILRGEVRERGGEARPGWVGEPSRWWRRREIPWDRSKAQALTDMRALLAGMDGQDDTVRALRRELDHMFPPERERAAAE